MSKVLITDTYLTDIANTIRNKKGVSTTYLPAEMSNAIQTIVGQYHIGTKTLILSMGTYPNQLTFSDLLGEPLAFFLIPEHLTNPGSLPAGSSTASNNHYIYYISYYNDQIDIGGYRTYRASGSSTTTVNYVFITGDEALSAIDINYFENTLTVQSAASNYTSAPGAFVSSNRYKLIYIY